jgi:O-antigen/teichoic acid export membrane protein
VHATLGSQWNAVIMPLRLLCVCAAFQGCQVLVAHVLNWTGQFRVMMWCTILAAVVMPVGFLVGANRGLVGIALAWAVLYPPVNLPPLIIGFRTIEITFGDWLGALKPAGCACSAMAAAVIVVRGLMPANASAITSLMVAMVAGAAVYSATLWFGFRRRVMEIVRFVKGVRGETPPPLAAAQ